MTQSIPTQTHSPTPFIQNWIILRQDTIILFNQLCLIKPYQENQFTHEVLNEFCEQLMKYISHGQFHIFKKIVLHINHVKPKTKKFDLKKLQKLIELNQDAVHFNHLYTLPDDLSHLESELSSLGESIALRLEIEDELLAGYKYIFYNNSILN